MSRCMRFALLAKRRSNLAPNDADNPVSERIIWQAGLPCFTLPAREVWTWVFAPTIQPGVAHFVKEDARKLR
jgi:hypothetical protein